MDIGTGSGNTFAWQTVWNMVVPGAGSSLDGTVIEFGSMDLTAVRLRGATAGSIHFEGWSGVTLSFGRRVPAGSVSMHSAGSIDAVAGESLSVASEAVSLSAGRSLDARVDGLASLSTKSLALSSSDDLSAMAGSLGIDVSGGLDVFSGDVASLNVGGLQASVRDDVLLDAAGTLGVVSETAEVGVIGEAGLTAQSVRANHATASCFSARWANSEEEFVSRRNRKGEARRGYRLGFFSSDM
eukprot:COSAG06_NODE_1522_length_9205_cov_36.374588_3_plen_241_part_00